MAAAVVVEEMEVVVEVDPDDLSRVVNSQLISVKSVIYECNNMLTCSTSRFASDSKVCLAFHSQARGLAWLYFSYSLFLPMELGPAIISFSNLRL